MISNVSRQEQVNSCGFSLLELVITLTILVILTLGVIPLVEATMKRQREQSLREALREIRSAIDEFHRDTVGMQCVGVNGSNINTQVPGQSPDPRSRVVIADCTVFTVDNPDHYPPDLETLVNGVNFIPRTNLLAIAGVGMQGNATDNSLLSMKKKVYLRGIPIDPITGKADWAFRSSYDASDATSWGGENFFDLHSVSTGTALDGTKYSDW